MASSLRPRVRLVKNSVRRPLRFDVLEARNLLCGDVCEIELLPLLDQFGEQIITVMGYKSPGEADEQARITTGIYDTGASVATLAYTDQVLLELLETPVPIKVPGGATADAIGGPLTGDVSQPGQLIADGLHAWTLSVEDILNEGGQGITLDASTGRADGIQMFVGTPEGSPSLPSIVGTVIHDPSEAHPNGLAAWIDMTAYAFDFGELFPDLPDFQGIVINMPDLRFVEPGTTLTAATDGSETAVMRIPLDLWGESNVANPGDEISYSYNPVQSSVSYALGGASVSGKTALFDTGAQLSVISTDIALSLGLNLDAPEMSITVQGAGGQSTIPGYTIDSLELPRDDNSDGVIDGTLRFTNVPIYVLDIVPGLDAILGMNLFNTAKGLLYDPHDPAGASLQVNFLTDLTREIPEGWEEELEAMNFLSAAFPAFGNTFAIPSFGVDVPIIEEPPPNAAPTNVSLSRDNVFSGIAGAWVGSVAATDPNLGDTHTFSVSDSRFEVRNGQLYLKPGVSIAPGSETSINLTLTATDAGGLSADRPFTLAVVAGPTTWEFAQQWAPLPEDVNADGSVDPLDALLVINAINASGPFSYSPGSVGGTVAGPFFDASGDNSIGVLDAALVINFINAGVSSQIAGEGEPLSFAVVDGSSVGSDDSTTQDQLAPLSLAPSTTDTTVMTNSSTTAETLWLAAWETLEQETSFYGPQLPAESKFDGRDGASNETTDVTLWELLWSNE